MVVVGHCTRNDCALATVARHIRRIGNHTWDDLFMAFAASFESTGATRAPFVFTAGRRTFNVVVERMWRIGEILLTCNYTSRKNFWSGIHIGCKQDTSLGSHTPKPNENPPQKTLHCTRGMS
jgi:hypothetical protein